MDVIGLFNARGEQIGHGLRIAGVSGEPGERATVLEVVKEGQPLPSVSLLVDRLEEPRTVQVICGMDQVALCDGLVAYSTAIDVLFGTKDGRLRESISPTWRNGILKRLHLFDGGIATGQRQQTMAKGATFTVSINRPARGLMQYGIVKSGKP